MKIINFDRRLLSIVLTLWLVSATGHAEIYKWVDVNGQTHYSERKDDGGKAKALDLKVGPDPARATTGSPQYWQDQERQFRQRQAEQQKPESALDKRPKSLSGGKLDETDASKCKLARDILSGAVGHRNGAPTDVNDRRIAENDIRLYCR